MQDNKHSCYMIMMILRAYLEFSRRYIDFIHFLNKFVG